MTYMRAWMSLKFGQIQPLVSMVTDRVMVGKTVSPLFLGCLNLGLIGPPTAELAALESLKKSP